jgi:hypothetical protein
VYITQWGSIWVKDFDHGCPKVGLGGYLQSFCTFTVGVSMVNVTEFCSKNISCHGHGTMTAANTGASLNNYISVKAIGDVCSLQGLPRASAATTGYSDYSD